MDQRHLQAEAEVRAAQRFDLVTIAQFVTTGAKVLDVGCGDGTLLELLEETRHVDGRGIEISREGVNACVARGLSVMQGDADTDLIDYPDDAFDFVILSQTLQATHHPREVIEQMLRIGRKAVVSFPNFGYWRMRLLLLFTGRMPVTKDLPYSWYDTPNIHFFTIRDFMSTARDMGVKIETGVAITGSGRRLAWRLPWWVWNVFGQQAVFLLGRR